MDFVTFPFHLGIFFLCILKLFSGANVIYKLTIFRCEIFTQSHKFLYQWCLHDIYFFIIVLLIWTFVSLKYRSFREHRVVSFKNFYSAWPFMLFNFNIRLFKINTTVSTVRFHSKFVHICYFFPFSSHFSFLLGIEQYWYSSWSPLLLFQLCFYYLILMVASGFTMCLFNTSVCKLIYSHVI